MLSRSQSRGALGGTGLGSSPLRPATARPMLPCPWGKVTPSPPGLSLRMGDPSLPQGRQSPGPLFFLPPPTPKDPGPSSRLLKTAQSHALGGQGWRRPRGPSPEALQKAQPGLFPLPEPPADTRLLSRALPSALPDQDQRRSAPGMRVGGREGTPASQREAVRVSVQGDSAGVRLPSKSPPAQGSSHSTGHGCSSSGVQTLSNSARAWPPAPRRVCTPVSVITPWLACKHTGQPE